MTAKMTRLERRRVKQEGEVRSSSSGQSRSGESLGWRVSSESAVKWKGRICFGGGSDGTG